MSSIASAAKEFYSTGEAASHLKTNGDAVRKLYDEGALQGDRVGHNKNRRISHESLVALMRQRGIPLGDLAPEAPVGDQPGTDASAPAASDDASVADEADGGPADTDAVGEGGGDAPQ